MGSIYNHLSEYTLLAKSENDKFSPVYLESAQFYNKYVE